MMKKTEVEIAKEVIDGKWGTGTARQRAITTAGYDYNLVQSFVNRMLATGQPIKECTVDAKNCCGVFIVIEQ